MRKSRGDDQNDKKREGGFGEELVGCRGKSTDGQLKDEVMCGCVDANGKKEGVKAGWREGGADVVRMNFMNMKKGRKEW